MPRETFRQEMQEVKDQVLLLSSMVEQAVMESVAALKNNDLAGARRILQTDVRINRRRFEIESSVVILIARQQPIAHDLRLLAACLDIGTELERIGDYAKGIANINLRSEGLSQPGILREVYSMGEQTVDMLHRAMTAFAEEESGAARLIIREDARIDECYIKLYNKAIESVLADPRNIERANYLIWAAHNLERVGDRVVNVCQRVIHIATGEHPGLDMAEAGPRSSMQEC